MEELKKTNSSLFFALNGVLDTEMGGGGGAGSLHDPPLDPPLRAECGELILFVFFSPDIQLLRLRLLPLKLRLPWRPQDRMCMLVSENQRSQIREITKFRLFTPFS